MSFYGLIVKPTKAAPYVPDGEGSTKLHISQATLDDGAKKGESVTVYAKVEDEEVIITRLTGGVMETAALDLVFDHYTEFRVKGPSAVHLVGYFIPSGEDEEDGFGMMGGEDEDDDSDDEEGLIELGHPPFGPGSDDSDDDEEDEDDIEGSDDDIPPPRRGGVVIEEVDEQGKPVKDTPAPKSASLKRKEADTPKSDKAAPPAKKPATPADKAADKAAATPASQDKKAAAEKAEKAKTPVSDKKPGLAVKEYDNGFKFEELQLGDPSGKVAKKGKTAVVRYRGSLASNGKVFDETKGGATFKFRLGVGEVIKGWDQGVQGMRVGDKRRLTVPPQMGYGSQGVKGAIPPNATLMFDVELVDVK